MSHPSKDILKNWESSWAKRVPLTSHDTVVADRGQVAFDCLI
jgi:hypothetical protein